MSGRPKNIFILTVDSLQANVYAELMDDITDVVQGVEFTNAFATASNTGSSMPALAAGVYCDEVADGTPDLNLGETSEDDEFTTLAEALAVRGYDCSLWSDNVIFGPARNYDRGFDAGPSEGPNWKKRAQKLFQKTGSDRLFNIGRWTYFSVVRRLENMLTSSGNYYKPADAYHQSVLRSLEETSTEQLHWIHYMDVHHPFEVPADYLASRPLNTERRSSKLAELSSQAIINNRGGNVSDEDIEDIEQAYRAACEYLRDQILDFARTLMERRHYVPGRDVFVLTADHGEGFDRELHGMLGHTPTPAFWDDLIHVPFVIGHPEWSSGTVDCQVSQIDLVPTVLNAVDAPLPTGLPGTAADRPSDLCRDYVYFSATGPYRSYHGVRSDAGWKLFADRITESDSVELTGMDADQDRERVLLTRVDASGEEIRFERRLNGNDRPSDTAAREKWNTLQQRLDQKKGSIATRRFDAKLSEETEKQLQQLGYVDNIRK